MRNHKSMPHFRTSTSKENEWIENGPNWQPGGCHGRLFTWLRKCFLQAWVCQPKLHLAEHGTFAAFICKTLSCGCCCTRQLCELSIMPVMWTYWCMSTLKFNLCVLRYLICAHNEIKSDHLLLRHIVSAF